MVNDSKYLEVILRVLEKEATPEEEQELQTWLQADQENLKFFNVFSRYWQAINKRSPLQTPDVDSLWKEISAKIESPATKSLRLTNFSGIWSRRIIYITVFVFLVLTVYAGYRFSLPEYYHLSKLQVWEQKGLAQTTRSAGAETDDFALAAQALLSAQQKRLGVLPYFDRDEVERAIVHLQKAFESSSDPLTRNKYAYYLGKAYLMQGKVELAKRWLRRVLESKAVAYQKEASYLLERL